MWYTFHVPIGHDLAACCRGALSAPTARTVMLRRAHSRASVMTGNGMAKSLKRMVGHSRRGPALTYCLSKTSTLLKGLPSALVPIVLKVRVFPSGETERMKTVINFPSFMDIPSRL